MTKECPICGSYFETDSNRRKYCDDCADHPERKRKKYERALAQSKRRLYTPNIFHGTCSQCGKEFEMYEHLVFDFFDDSQNHKIVFCSKKCQTNWKHDHANCTYCGKSLKDNPYYDPSNANTKYCSDECRDAYKREQDVNNPIHLISNG